MIMAYLAKNSFTKTPGFIFSIILFLAAGAEAQDATLVYKAAAPAVASLEALDLNGNVLWSGTGFFGANRS